MKISTRQRALAGVALTGAAMLLLSGCGAAPEKSEGSGEKKNFLACAVSDEGSWNDKSFNEAAMGGLIKAKDELGIKLSDAESHSTEDFDTNLTAMVNAGCDITFAVGFDLIGPVNATAKANPELNFVSVDGYSEGNDNLKPVEYASDQSSYLAGYLAAAYSKTKVIGTYAGLNVPAVTIFMDGYYYGAKAWEKETGTPITVVGYDPANKDAGDYVGNFADSGKAKSISAGQLEKGADVIYPVAGGLFSATSEAIKESGKDAVFIGVDKDIAVTSPEYADQVLVSVEKRMTDAVYDVIKETLDKGFNSEPYLGTLANKGTVLSSFHKFEDKVSPEIVASLKKIEEGIIDGSIDPLK
ncbi:BMP family lipoprotein [Mycetocola spongiae]|uniref:BMP family lipoprotein n=1 Tax=Mycetocola spongiae TaxID=2859226 RepID=UPI001CF5B033|nr:BMP family ABC transporter substrate-binding protein [Mycetocola spongiae]UCR88024.1 BMP family ABC transporter substrate-binding protein [Mycetocola spongiae]